jgi:hypothetical protein
MFRSGSAQSDFRNGYVITNSNDTLFGLADYKENRSNAKKCIFIKEGSSEKVEYSPNDINAYRFLDGKLLIHFFSEISQTI